MTKNLVKVSQCGSCVLSKLACAAWRFLSRLSALRKRGSCDNKPQSHEEPGRDTTADSPLRTRDPRDFAARFHQTRKNRTTKLRRLCPNGKCLVTKIVRSKLFGDKTTTCGVALSGPNCSKRPTGLNYVSK